MNYPPVLVTVFMSLVLPEEMSLKTGGLSRQVVSQDRWSFKTGGFSRQFVSQDRLSLTVGYKNHVSIIMNLYMFY